MRSTVGFVNAINEKNVYRIIGRHGSKSATITRQSQWATNKGWKVIDLAHLVRDLSRKIDRLGNEAGGGEI